MAYLVEHSLIYKKLLIIAYPQYTNN